MVYGSDAMIPGEVQENSPRFQSFVVEESNERRTVNLDLLDKVHDHARINSKALKRMVELKHKTKTKPRQFKVVDLVMRKAHPYQIENKFSPKWSGLFRIVEALGNSAYKLETLEGGAIPRTWNAIQLKFYQLRHLGFLYFPLNIMLFEVTLFFPQRGSFNAVT